MSDISKTQRSKMAIEEGKKNDDKQCSRIISKLYHPPNDAQAEYHHHQERSANIHHEFSRRDLLHLHFLRMSVRRAIDDTIAEVLGTLLLGQLCLAFLLHEHDACPWVRRVERLLARLAVVVYEGWVVVFTPLLDLMVLSDADIANLSKRFTNLATCDRDTNKVGVCRVCFVMDSSRVFTEDQADFSWVRRTHDELVVKIK